MPADSTYTYGVKPGEGANREAMRKRRKPSVVQGARGTALEAGMEAAREAGGGIQAGAHPELLAPTPLDQAAAFIKKLFGGSKPKK